jgi:hypothetical protein
MKHLSIFQKNCLLTGTLLAAELVASCPQRRAFVVVGAYVQTPEGSARVSKFLNADHSNVRFWLRKYEVKREDVERYLADQDLLESVHLTTIESIEALEAELHPYVEDLQHLQVSWKVDDPLS